MEMRYVYTFRRRYSGKPVEFGPYLDEDEAKAAYQRIYGTWPEDALDVREYVV